MILGGTELVKQSGSLIAKAHLIPAYLPREIAKAVDYLAGHLPVVVITGMRQVGKSTMLVNDPLFKDREYVSLEDDTTRAAANANPAGLLASNMRVSIDEAQKAPDLFPAVRRAVRENRYPGRFILSGSASLPLRKASSETLAGDAIYLHMGPLTRREISRATDQPPFLTEFIAKPTRVPLRDFKSVTDVDVERGGMPAVALGSREQGHVWLAGYEQAYLERDLLDISRIENIPAFKALLSLLAHRSAQILNVDQLAVDLGGVARNTVKNYLGLLQLLFVINMVSPYSKNVRVASRKHSKVVLEDSGIACYLSGISHLAAHPLRGFMYETYVFQNIYGILQAHARDWTIHYWRTNGKEVDFVIDTRSQAVGLEVKCAESVGASDKKNMLAFMKAAPDCRLGVLAYNGSSTEDLGDNIWAVPMGLLLS